MLCDLDGTLVDTREANFAAYAAALQEVGCTVSAEVFDAMAFGRHWRDFLPALLGPGADAEAVARRKRALYPALFGRTRLNRPLVEFVRDARAGRRTALVTTASRATAEGLLHVHGLADLFDAVVTGDDVDRHKPDPEAYRTAASRLGVAPERCLAFEDSAPGLASARAAGMAVFEVRF